MMMMLRRRRRRQRGFTFDLSMDDAASHERAPLQVHSSNPESLLYVYMRNNLPQYKRSASATVYGARRPPYLYILDVRILCVLICA